MPSASGEVESPEGSSFKRALDEAEHVERTTPTTAQNSSDPVAALARDVEAGRLSVDQAVERLLNQTLARADGYLTSAQRSELSELLRGALLQDPTLRQLRGER